MAKLINDYSHSSHTDSIPAKIWTTGGKKGKATAVEGGADHRFLRQTARR